MTALRTDRAVPDADRDRTGLGPVVVVFGATGDLAARKLLPAVGRLLGEKDHEAVLVGVGRSSMTDQQFWSRAAAPASPVLRARPGSVRYVGGSYDAELFSRLRVVLIELGGGSLRQVVFYLSVPADAVAVIIEGLGRGEARGRLPLPARLILEKPIGHNATSAAQIQRLVERWFEPDQVLLVDHYLGKDGLWNLLAARLGSSVFEPLWDRRWIDHVQITVAETHGIEHRASFYESTGATRDVLQNHVLQLVALTMMDLPEHLDAQHIHAEKLKLLQSVRPPRPEEMAEHAVRGRYSRSFGPETYAAVRLEVDSPRWAGVPCFIRTGKRLAAGFAEVVVQFRSPPGVVGAALAAHHAQPSQLVVRLQPEETVSLGFSTTRPGHPHALQPQSMVFARAPEVVGPPTDAYERLLADAVRGDRTLFVEPAEILESWRIVDPVVEAFEQGLTPMKDYHPGGWGPPSADRMISLSGRGWRNRE